MVKIGHQEEQTEEVVEETPKPSKKEQRRAKKRKKEHKRAQKERKKTDQFDAADKSPEQQTQATMRLFAFVCGGIGIALLLVHYVIVPLFTPGEQQVLQVADDIRAGEVIDPDKLAVVNVPESAVFPTMATTMEEIEGIASRDLVAGEPLLITMVTEDEQVENMDEYLYTAITFASTPVLQDGALVQVYARSGGQLDLLFDEPKRVYANSTIGGYAVEDDGTGRVESPNVLLTDEEFDAYQQAVANEEVIIAARIHPERVPGTEVANAGQEPTEQEIIAELYGLMLHEVESLEGFESEDVAVFVDAQDAEAFSSIEELEELGLTDEQVDALVTEGLERAYNGQVYETEEETEDVEEDDE